MYDVVIIGAGAIGCSVARYLSQYDAKICVVEKDEDVCCGTSKANSAIVHAGYDAEYGTLKAKYNIEGSRMFEELACDWIFRIRRTEVSLYACTMKICPIFGNFMRTEKRTA